MKYKLSESLLNKLPNCIIQQIESYISRISRVFSIENGNNIDEKFKKKKYKKYRSSMNKYECEIYRQFLLEMRGIRT